MKKHLINALTGLSFATIFLYLTLRNKPLDEIFVLLGEARLNWILLSVISLVVVFLIRALRWKLLLENAGEKPRLKDVSYSLLLGIFINSFTPRLGEVIRCTSMEKSSGISTSKSLGTVISERFYDIFALLLGIVAILIFESDRLGSLVLSTFKNLFASLADKFGKITLILLLTALVIVALYYLAKRIGFKDRIRDFWRGVVSTAKMTFRIKNSRTFAFQTLLIWGVMTIMNYACLKALPSTDSLSLYFAMVALFIGSIGWAIPSPGGIGTSHFFILQLFILFNLKEDTGIAYGLLVNGVTILFTIAAGFVSIAVVTIIRFAKKNKEQNIDQLPD